MIQVEGLDLFPGPVRLLEELDAGIDARLGIEAVDVQVGVQDLEAVVIDDFRQQLLQADAMQGVVLVVDVSSHGPGSAGMAFSWGNKLATVARRAASDQQLVLLNCKTKSPWCPRA
ncbi:hypothetical protein SDC9_154648 [bioreactor metagenome]|uniref:Uncharacterized protein n=1 Tax=bioreactor metagenome TaxID=1076179 RepID=A0A645F1S5_9ZZZZ